MEKGHDRDVGGDGQVRPIDAKAIAHEQSQPGEKITADPDRRLPQRPRMKGDLVDTTDFVGRGAIIWMKTPLLALQAGTQRPLKPARIRTTRFL